MLSPPAVVALGPAEALERARAYLQRYDKKGHVDRAIAALEPSLQRDGSNAALHAALAEAYVRKYDETASKQWLQMAIESGRKAVARQSRPCGGARSPGHGSGGKWPERRGGRPFRGGPRSQSTQWTRPHRPGQATLRSGSRAARITRRFSAALVSGRPLHELAAFYHRDARYEESVATWRQALQLAPDNVPVMVYLAAGFHMKGQYAEAADTLQRALALDATNASGWANLGTARYFQGRYPDAVRATEKAVGSCSRPVHVLGQPGRHLSPGGRHCRTRPPEPIRRPSLWSGSGLPRPPTTDSAVAWLCILRKEVIRPEHWRSSPNSNRSGTSVTRVPCSKPHWCMSNGPRSG